MDINKFSISQPAPVPLPQKVINQIESLERYKDVCKSYVDTVYRNFKSEEWNTRQSEATRYLKEIEMYRDSYSSFVKWEEKWRKYKSNKNVHPKPDNLFATDVEAAKEPSSKRFLPFVVISLTLVFSFVPMLVNMSWGIALLYLVCISVMMGIVSYKFIDDDLSIILVVCWPPICVMLWVLDFKLWFLNFKSIAIVLLALLVLTLLILFVDDVRVEIEKRNSFKEKIQEIEGNIEHKKYLEEEIKKITDGNLFEARNIILDESNLRKCMNTAISNACKSFPYKDSLARAKSLFWLDSETLELKDDSSKLFAEIDEEITKLRNNG